VDSQHVQEPGYPVHDGVYHYRNKKLLHKKPCLSGILLTWRDAVGMTNSIPQAGIIRTGIDWGTINDIVAATRAGKL